VLLRSNLAGQADEPGQNMLTGVRLEPFVDPLPVPPVVHPIAENSDSQHYRITMSEFRQKVHRDLPPTVLWGFEGCTPGPTIIARHSRTVTVDWVNKLPTRHRLAVDCTLDGAGKDIPEVRTTIHLHGGHVAASSDGYPEDWIIPGHRQRTIYNNRQTAATLWYHDHAMGITRLNAMMGLAGFYILRDPEEESLRLPSGRYDVPLVLQDRTLDARGQIAYPVGPKDAPWAPEFFGTHVLVNGRVWPYFNVEPRLYRLRILNASNARVFQLSLAPEQPFFQIGSDGGLLSEPVTRNEMLIAPSERLDVVVDFRGREGRRIMLINTAPAPYPSGSGPIVRLITQFRVHRPLSAEIESHEVPAQLAPVPRLQEASAVKTRRLTLTEQMAGNGRPHRMLLNGMRFMDPVTEDPLNGDIEIWEFVNTTIDAHPIHLHAVHFQVLDRRPFDVRRQQRTSEIVFTGKAIEAKPEEQGWKDTVLCPPEQVTRIIAPFSGEPGRFVWHCHMLEHEDNEMMRPYILRSR
jgi:spore coat protein A, manganese oxidase